MAVFFHLKDIKYKVDKKQKKKSWITNVIRKERFFPGEINIILTSDKSLLQINKDFLKHNYLTDVITFDYSEDNIISGDVFISIDRIIDNAKKYKCTAENELNRVIIHGILHLLKYKDKSEKEKKEMTEKENYYIKMI